MKKIREYHMKLPKLNKKGAELSLNVIIIVILALIVLLVVALFFSEGVKKLFGREAEVSGLQIDPQIKALAVSTCELHCATNNEDGWVNPNFPKELVEQGIKDCDGLSLTCEFKQEL
ncbi:hypothetical protein HZB88_05105 [archaeon]|nr:hypothetical protein [archaeon]